MALFWEAYHDIIMLFAGALVLTGTVYLLIHVRQKKKIAAMDHPSMEHDGDHASSSSERTQTQETRPAVDAAVMTEPGENKRTSETKPDDLPREPQPPVSTDRPDPREEEKTVESDKTHQNDEIDHGKNTGMTDDEKKETPSKKSKDLGKYHVLYRKDEGTWYVKREGSDKVLRVLPTQKEAVAWATIKAIHQDTALIIHRRDGRIRKHEEI